MASPSVNGQADLDAPLVARLKEGDMDALAQLYLRHGGAVRTVLLRADPSRSHATADDLCQETFLTFLDTVARYQHRGQLRGWLYGIALRKARAHRRRWWRRLSLRRQDPSGASGIAAPPASVEARVGDRQQIDRLLQSLPEAQREALVLVALEGLSVQAAADALQISENAVSTRLYRARQALQRLR